jgi:hypothetical protein
MLLQDIPSSDPVDQDEGDVWETVGVMDERSTSLALAAEDIVPEGTQEQTGVVELQPSVEEVQRAPPAASATVGQPEE